MTSAPVVYPPTPINIDARIVDPSPEFKREVFLVLGSIVTFILTYLILVVAGVILAFLCGYAGILLIVTFPKFITLALGIGLMGVGIMVLFFLFKFIFSTSKTDRSNLIEITEREHPFLFEFIRTLASETETPMPKRVYISPEVNACVFYDSGFWSMFLPVRKNLQIGLGLVNSVNVSEFKAIIAHEFGHFSQRSMTLGTYVYNVNRVIYNLLYDNDGYKDSLQAWANFSNYFYVFAQLTGGIVSGIQSLLKLQYTQINKRYLALSRQMEFHADSVAASVSGSKPLITSLRRLEVVDTCYNRVLDHYSSWYGQNRKAVNIYKDHTTVIGHFASQHNLPTENGVLHVTADSFAGTARCRVSVKDQWASHPSTDDREKHLNRLNVSCRIVATPAWSLFNSPEELQQKVTNHLYRSLHFKSTPELIDSPTFASLYEDSIDKYKFDSSYKGFYDNRVISAFEVHSALTTTVEATALGDVLTEATLNLPSQINGMEADINVLQNIVLKTSSIETFEFNNQKFNKEEASVVLETIKKDVAASRARLKKADQDIFLLYHKRISKQGNDQEAIDAYLKLFTITQSSESSIKEVESILREVGQLFSDGVTQGMAVAVTINMTRKEVPVKEKIKSILDDAHCAGFFTADEKEILERYASNKWMYYTEPRLDSDAINLFVQAMNIYAGVLSKRAFEMKRQMLAQQAHVINFI